MSLKHALALAALIAAHLTERRHAHDVCTTFDSADHTSIGVLSSGSG
ncbi:MAG: hypothetical protein NZ699_19555 [Roseiflexus sp.]|nr:hypothetical protein [Roseiflexus sp.]MCS7291318.1 hypothetical protein [Roseiflexus sp.]MDW8146637.1 hypothetical protein [Roseiflexaceae bacterium]MDW8232901.1 hypothetical protein [Roseiflexaceae bacterium]